MFLNYRGAHWRFSYKPLTVLLSHTTPLHQQKGLRRFKTATRDWSKSNETDWCLRVVFAGNFTLFYLGGFVTKRICGKKTKALVHCLPGTPCQIKHTWVDFRELWQKTTNLVHPFNLLHIWEVDLRTEWQHVMEEFMSCNLADHLRDCGWTLLK